MKAISADSNSPLPERAWKRVTGRRHSDCFQPEDSLRTIIMVDSTHAQSEIHPIVYKFPSIPPFHTQPQIKAALGRFTDCPLSKGASSRCAATSLVHGAGKPTAAFRWALSICPCLGLSGQDGTMLHELRDLGSDPCSDIKTDQT